MLILKKKFEADLKNNSTYLRKFKSPFDPESCELIERDFKDEKQISFLKSLFDAIMSGMKEGKFDKIIPMYDEDGDLVNTRGAKILVDYFEIGDDDGEAFITINPAYIDISLDEPDFDAFDEDLTYILNEDLDKLDRTDESRLVKTVYNKILREWKEVLDGLVEQLEY